MKYKVSYNHPNVQSKAQRALMHINVTDQYPYIGLRVHIVPFCIAIALQHGQSIMGSTTCILSFWSLYYMPYRIAPGRVITRPGYIVIISTPQRHINAVILGFQLSREVAMTGFWITHIIFIHIHQTPLKHFYSKYPMMFREHPV